MPVYLLPPELTAIVVSYLTLPPDYDPRIVQPLEPVGQYACINREWQMVVERHTFSTLDLTTPERLTQFEHIVVKNSQRCACVHRINLVVQLEAYDLAARARFESADEHGRNNGIFTSTIQTLFGILQAWPEDHTTRGIHLSIQAQSPSDAVDRTRVREARRNPKKDLRGRRYEKNYLQFAEESLDGLAAVSAITELSVAAAYAQQRLIAPASCALIASKLPRLRDARLELRDNEKRDLALRKRNRNEFVHSFDHWPSSVERFYLAFYNEPPLNQTIFPPDIMDEHIEDPLSARLRTFSQQLSELSLDTIVVGRELFWPIATEAETGQLLPLPHWPHLMKLIVTYTIATPDGRWYFERDPAEPEVRTDHGMTEAEYARIEEDGDEYLLPPIEDRFSDTFRKKPAAVLMNDFYVAAGRAAQRMPKLRQMLLDAENRVSHSFRYIVTGTTAMAEWGDVTGFKPEERVLQVWRDVAALHTGSDNNLEVKLRDLSVPYYI